MSTKKKSLRYSAVAKNFHEALPVGNGRLGAMVYGGTHTDRLSLNEDSLWAGVKAPSAREGGPQALTEIRRLMANDQRRQAQRVIEKDLLSPFVQPYLPAGDLISEMDIAGEVEAYERGLDLEAAVAWTEFRTSGVSVRKTVLSSRPDEVIVLRYASEDGPLPAIRFSLSSLLSHELLVSEEGLTLRGTLPTNVRWNAVDELAVEENFISYGPDAATYVLAVQIAHCDGQVVQTGGALEITGATDVALHISCASSHRVPHPGRTVRETLEASICRSHDEVLDAHQVDYRSLFGRMTLELGSTGVERKTDDWLEYASDNAPDPAILERMFDFGRYLMIASSRPDTMPANLQGIWNESLTPPWWSNYTININLQMNYWAAEACGLGECHTPLFTFLERLAENGRGTAKDLYGVRGWCVHHQTDLHATTTPVGFLPYKVWEGSAKWALWVMGGPWLCLHAIEHYRYSGDEAFLARFLPVLAGAAEFLLDWLIDDPRHTEFLTTCPSTSPENTYLWQDEPCAVAMGSTMDIAIARSFFTAFLDVLPDTDGWERLKADIETALHRLPEPQVSDDGRILEYDDDFPEAEAPHRHISHLFDLCPGDRIRPGSRLAKAAQRALEYRGDTGTGWSLVWKARCYARLGMGDKAFELLSSLFTLVPSNQFDMGDDGGGVYPNFFFACPPLMIDANFGYLSALLDMLVQVHDNRIFLLPALPTALPNGRLSDIHLPSGIRLRMTWRNGRLMALDIWSPEARNIEVCYEGRQETLQVQPEVWTQSRRGELLH